MDSSSAPALEEKLRLPPAMASDNRNCSLGTTEPAARPGAEWVKGRQGDLIDRRSQFVGRRRKNSLNGRSELKSLKYSFKKRSIVLTSKEDKSNWSPPSVPEKEREEMVARW